MSIKGVDILKPCLGKNIKIGYFVLGIVVLSLASIAGVSLVADGVYFDMTPEKSLSLSEETVNMLQKQDKAIVIRLFISEKLAKKNPELNMYAKDVSRLLGTYHKEGKGLIKTAVVEVEPFSSSQAEAEKAGIQKFALSDGRENVYLGMSLTDERGRTLAIPRLIPERRDELESDISRLISILAAGRQPRLGVLSPYFRAANEKDPLRYAENMPFVNELSAGGYEIVSLSSSAPAIPEGIDAVLLFYPLNLDRIAVYALDQYLMWGGKIMIMLDTFAEERFRDKEKYIGYRSGIQQLLNNSGVTYREDILVGDNANSRTRIFDEHYIKYPFWLKISGDNIADHPITRGINELYLNYSGFFEYVSKENLETTVLFSTGADSGAMLTEKTADLNYDNLLKNYALTNKKYPLALLIEGNFSSLFDQPLVWEQSILSSMSPFLKSSADKGALLVVGDSDMAGAFLWDAGRDKKHGVYDAATISDNIRFMLKALDYLTQSNYVSVSRKEKRFEHKNLSEVFSTLAADSYGDQKKQITSDLIEIRQKMVAAGERLQAVPLPSIKQIKEIEEMQRKITELEEGLRRIEYLTEEKYQDYLFMFALLMVVLLPVLSVAAARIGYFCYNRYIQRKAKEFVK